MDGVEIFEAKGRSLKCVKSEGDVESGLSYEEGDFGARNGSVLLLEGQQGRRMPRK